MARALREKYGCDAEIVLVPDQGQQEVVNRVAAAVGGGFVVRLPEGLGKNDDIWDVAEEMGDDVAQQVLLQFAPPGKHDAREK